MTEAVPTWNPDAHEPWHPSTYWAALKSTGLMPEPSDDPTSIPEAVGEVPPDLVFTAGAPVAPPKHRPAYANPTFRGLMGRIGPGAAEHFEAEVRAISHNAIVVLDAVERLNELDDGDPEAAHGTADGILLELVPDEVKAAYLAARDRVGFWFA